MSKPTVTSITFTTPFSSIEKTLDRLDELNDIVVIPKTTTYIVDSDGENIYKNKKKYLSKYDYDDDFINTNDNDIKKAIVKYYYKKITQKWLLNDKKYKTLLQYIKLNGDKCEISGKSKDDIYDYNNATEAERQIINKKIKCFADNFLDKDDIELLLLKIINKENVSWRVLNKKENKRVIKKYLFKKLEKKLSNKK